MRGICLIGLAMIFGLSASADEPIPLPVPDAIGAPKIRLPMLPSPVGPPAPQPVTVLAEDHFYCIDSDVQLIVLASRVGYVSVTSDTGPMKIRGKFADGTGKVETRTYSGKYIYTVEAVAKGQVELLIVPQGVMDESEVLRRTLSVLMPRPPPPDPEPEPEPDPEPTAKHVRLSIVTDKDNLPPGPAILLNALVGWNALQDAGHEYRLYDIQSTEPDALTAIAELSGKIPGMVVTNKDTGAVMHKDFLPKTFADLKTLVGRLTGG